MAPRFGDQVLEVFDVPDDAYDFLAAVVEARAASPHDLKLILDQSLIAGAESWYHQLDRAWDRGDDSCTLPTADNNDDEPCTQPWEATDRLIEHAKLLAQKAATLSAAPGIKKKQGKDNTLPSSKRKQDASSSYYWAQDEDEIASSPTKRFHLAELPNTSILRLNLPAPGLQPSCVYPEEPGDGLQEIHTSSGISPYFTTPTKAPRPVVLRPSPGTVSVIPFPPLSSEYFGIIQEQVAHEPFWLLLAVTFLIKTKGEHAIPTLLRLKERFPAPCDIANPINAGEILDMIRHLGLCQNRLGIMHKYAQAFMFNPPRPGVRHPVKRYDVREASQETQADMTTTAAAAAVEDVTDGWEIGHMTQGIYTVDSWRIFCRDVLLGRAKDWNGKGAARSEFQPEWMRVRPADKELRAYLRWMWMRDGWEWDPATGERTVLREELRRAVEEGRVEYDIYGGLRVLDE